MLETLNSKRQHTAYWHVKEWGANYLHHLKPVLLYILFTSLCFLSCMGYTVPNGRNDESINWKGPRRKVQARFNIGLLIRVGGCEEKAFLSWGTVKSWSRECRRWAYWIFKTSNIKFIWNMKRLQWINGLISSRENFHVKLNPGLLFQRQSTRRRIFSQANST